MGTWSRKRLNELHGSCSVPNCGAFERELEVVKSLFLKGVEKFIISPRFSFVVSGIIVTFVVN